MKVLLIAACLLATQAATSCQTEADVRPANYDALALETGHWEWESTAYMSGKRTPATEGFTRQLVFTPDRQVLITHNRQFNKQTTYVLSMGTVCGAPQTSPIITYETDSDLPNNDRKTYQTTQMGTDQHLMLVGEHACVDGGAYETYRWVKE